MPTGAILSLDVFRHVFALCIYLQHALEGISPGRMVSENKHISPGLLQRRRASKFWAAHRGDIYLFAESQWKISSHL